MIMSCRIARPVLDEGCGLSCMVLVGVRRVTGMSAGEPGGTYNTMSGGVVVGPLVMGRDITVTLPPTVPTALDGLRAPSAEFVGRTAVLEELLELLDPGRSGPGVAWVSAVAGLGGVGKTELAVHAAHAALERAWFPGGVLMVDLHGYEDAPQRLDAGTALDGLLRAVGVPGEYVPSAVQDRQRLFRAVLAEYAAQGRPILVVIDNASPDAPAEPLLLGTGRVVVTSRHTLADLGGRLIDLDTLTEGDSVELLGRLLQLKRGGADTRVADEAAAARRIGELCGGLPLAVEIVAALLAAHPRKPLAVMVGQLEAEHTRLAELRHGQRAVRAAFELSYQALPAELQRLFRMLSINPGPTLSAPAAAVLTEAGDRVAQHRLEELAEAHLVEPADGYGRWRMHDLVRLYAISLRDQHTDADGREAALGRLLEFYLATTRAADAHLKPTEPDPADPASLGFVDRGLALGWLDAELPNLTAAVHAAATAHPDIAIDLPLALWRFLDWRRLFNDWITLTGIALEIARRTGDRHGEGMALNNLGIALREVRRFAEAITAHQDAAAVFRETGDRHSEGMALTGLGVALREVWRFEEAITAWSDAAEIFAGLIAFRSHLRECQQWCARTRFGAGRLRAVRSVDHAGRR